MAASIPFISALFLLTLISQGHCQCDNVSNFIISQSQTGQKIANKTEWNVTIKNDCLCTRGEIKLDCTGFQNAENTDPSVLKVIGNECLINNGGVLHGFESFSFTYAWDTQFQFKAKDSSVECS
ncbi:uncharacterized protein LOC8272276 [Ricinus communis]|uniref:uncharacterized protein LOC8272276 n=1 Tax=Ricinus communis TaxID=3988 RepID=UPI00201A26B9|nr:uncharacterized protein LOC8272276 [Ricinus communis]